MPKQKKKQTKPERREARLRKARQWVLTYQGSHIVRAYRKRFHVDVTCALKDLGEIGALAPKKLAAMKQAEQIRLEKKQHEREAKKQQDILDRYPDADDHFFYLAGYTPGGVPYGITWGEMDMESWESFYPDEES